MDMKAKAITITFVATLMFVGHATGQDAMPENMDKIAVDEGGNATVILLPTPKYVENRTDLFLELRNGDLGLIPVDELQKQVQAWTREHLHADLPHISNDALPMLATNTLSSGPFIIDLAYLPLAKLAITPDGPLSDCSCVPPSGNEISPCALALLNGYEPRDCRINLIVRNTPPTTVETLSSYAKQMGFAFTAQVLGTTEPVMISIRDRRPKDEK